jgi:ubiquinone/menaquinone biosynthesis C-methylase UbiE
MDTKHPDFSTSYKPDHVCPWWMAYSFDNPLRRIFHNPDKIFSRFILKGQTVLDIGCGMGYFTLEMANLVGSSGKVIAVDIQDKMLAITDKRLMDKGLDKRVQIHKSSPDCIGIKEPIDFVLAFWMVHEVSNKESFLIEIRNLLKTNGRFLIVEPRLHVSESYFAATIKLAGTVDLIPCDPVKIALSRAVLLKPV